jgi:hypothetical protein
LELLIKPKRLHLSDSKMTDARPMHYLRRAAMKEARTRMSFFSYEELGIRQVRAAGPREK